MAGKVKVSVHTNFMDAYTGAQYLEGDTIEVTEGRYAELSERLGAGVSRTDGPVPASAVTLSSDEAKPTADNTKAQIQAWLEANGIEYPAKATKAELLALVP